VFLNAAVLGIPREDVRRRMDHIIEFAGLRDFIDMPVKNYSSGMYVRLGFAVAVEMDPDILLMDEVLAVGDMAFQMKCFDRIRDFQKRGQDHPARLPRPGRGGAVLRRGEADPPGPAGRAGRSLRGGPDLHEARTWPASAS
jgi:hypothetical protein